MVCPGCRCQQVDGAAYCRACGTRLEGAAAGLPPGTVARLPGGTSGSSGQQAWMPLGGSANVPPGYGAGAPPYGAGGNGAGYGMGRMRRERVRQNLQPMGITWCLWGMYRLVMGAVAGFTVHAIARRHMWGWDGGDEFVPDFLATFWPVIAVGLVVTAGLALLTGYGLLTAKRWGRPLAIVMAIVSLIKIPLGTALGIYTLWVLGPRVSGEEYEALARSAPGQG